MDNINMNETGEYEDYGHDQMYEEYLETNEDREKIDEDKRTVSEDGDEVYEEYDGDYESYEPRYADYVQKTLTCHKKLIKNKWWILLIVLLPLIVGVVVGLLMGLNDSNCTAECVPDFNCTVCSRNFGNNLDRILHHTYSQ